jgi:hypothetical protein
VKCPELSRPGPGLLNPLELRKRLDDQLFAIARKNAAG